MSETEKRKQKLRENLAGDSRTNVGREFFQILFVLILIAGAGYGGYFWLVNRKITVPVEIEKYNLDEIANCEEVFRTIILDRLMPKEFKFKKIFPAHCQDTNEVRAWIKTTKINLLRCRNQKYESSNAIKAGINPCSFKELPDMGINMNGTCQESVVRNFSGELVKSGQFYRQFLKDRLVPEGLSLTEEQKIAYYKWIKYLTVEVISDYDMPEHICQKSVQVINLLHQYLLTSGK
jgi:hypothetical protein